MSLRKSLAWRLLRWLLPCAAAVLFGVWIVAVLAARDQLARQIDSTAMADVRIAAAQLDRIFLTVQHSTESMAEIVSSREFDNRTVAEFVKVLLTDLRQFNAIVCGGSFAPVPPPGTDSPMTMCYYTLSGENFSGRMLGTPDYRYWEMNWFTRSENSGRTHWSEPYFDEGGGNILMTTCSVPYFKKVNGKRQFAGVLTVDLDLRKLERILKNIELHGIGYAVLLSRQGCYLSHPDSSRIGKESVLTMAKRIHSPELEYAGRRMMAGGEGVLPSIISSVSKVPTRLFYTPVPSTGWSVGVGFPLLDLMRPLRSIEFKLTLVCLAGLAVLLGGMLVLCRRITQPLLNLSDAARGIGRGNFQAELPEYKQDDEIGVLTQSFRQMQVELTRFVRELEDSTAARVHLEGEVQAASAIQRSQLPKLSKEMLKDSRYGLGMVLRPAKSVGGDLYDFLLYQNRYAVLTIGDVAGKGIPASLFMTVTQTLQRSQLHYLPDLSAIADAVNDYLCRNNDAMLFVTWFCAVVDLETGEVYYVSAGHNPPRIRRVDGTLEKLGDTDDAPLGVLEGHYARKTLRLEPGDTLFCYTDGVTEAMSPEREQYGEERMDALLAGLPQSASAQDWVDAQLADLAKFVKGAPQSDDITMLCFRYRPEKGK